MVSRGQERIVRVEGGGWVQKQSAEKTAHARALRWNLGTLEGREKVSVAGGKKAGEECSEIRLS